MTDKKIKITEVFGCDRCLVATVETRGALCAICSNPAETETETKPIATYSAGCVECTAGFVLSGCDGVNHADVEIQNCDTCATLDGDDSAALRFVRLAEWLAPDALADLNAIVTNAIRNPDPDSGARVETDADGVVTITIETERS